ncbi:hypothetical protein BDF22DRAFT_116356 [Syncephalis plumigaleata]|nr:hypothetical protein BDF22DRAFT_116356 [Syncephalis plumigaleata]
MRNHVKATLFYRIVQLGLLWLIATTAITTTTSIFLVSAQATSSLTADSSQPQPTSFTLSNGVAVSISSIAASPGGFPSAILISDAPSPTLTLSPSSPNSPANTGNTTDKPVSSSASSLIPSETLLLHPILITMMIIITTGLVTSTSSIINVVHRLSNQ